MNGKINQATKKVQELYERLFKTEKWIEPSKVPKNVEAFY